MHQESNSPLGHQIQSIVLYVTTLLSRYLKEMQAEIDLAH